MPQVSDVRDGDVLLFRKSRSAFGRFIRLFTAAAESHAALAVWASVAGVRQPCALESIEPGGVRLYPLARYVHEITIDRYLPRDGHGWLAAAFGFRQLGQPYVGPRQFLISFGAFTRRVRKLLGREPANLDPRRWFCSELVAAALSAAGYRLPKTPWELVPADLAKLECLKFDGELTADALPKAA